MTLSLIEERDNAERLLTAYKASRKRIAAGLKAARKAAKLDRRTLAQRLSMPKNVRSVQGRESVGAYAEVVSREYIARVLEACMLSPDWKPE